MFYQTQVKSIIQGGVIDVHGKELSFIGNKLVKKGDFVWTDDKVVFGHTPIRGGGVLHAEQSGIPVLANNLRGYFNLNGDFKSYNIVGDDWIVNNKKFYAHDVHDSEIIDAEITDDGDVYTVVKNITQLEGNDENFYYRYHFETGHSYQSGFFWLAYSMSDYSGFPTGGNYQKSLYPFSISSTYADFVKHEDSILKSCEVIIFKNSTKITSIDFVDVIELAETTALEYTYLDSVAEAPSLAYYCKKSRAILYNFKILPSGNYTYLLRVETWAERYQLETGVSNPYVNGSIPVLANFLFKVTADEKRDNDIQILAKTVKRFPFLFHYQIAEFPSEDKESYEFISPPNFPYTTTMTASAFGNPYYFWLYKVWDSEMLPNANEYKNGVKEFSNDFSFPIQDNFYTKMINLNSNINLWQLEGIYDEDNKKIFGSLPNSDAHKWNTSFVPLKNGYLFGIHNGTLYLINSDGSIEPFGDSLKNFRLRALKRISKAKK